MEPLPEKWSTIWDLIIKSIMAGVLIVGGLVINSSIKGRQIDAQFIQIAVGILQSEIKENNEQDKKLRQWAIRIIDKYSDVDLEEKEKEALETNPLPKFPISGATATGAEGILKKGFLPWGTGLESVPITEEEHKRAAAARTLRKMILEYEEKNAKSK